MPAVEWPQLANSLTETIRSVALEMGMTAEQADSFALAAVHAIIKEVFDGGGQYYVPSPNTISRRMRNSQIQKQYETMTIKEIAEQWPDISEITIRRVLNPNLKEDRRQHDQQADLF